MSDSKNQAADQPTNGRHDVVTARLVTLGLAAIALTCACGEAALLANNLQSSGHLSTMATFATGALAGALSAIMKNGKG